MARTVVHVLDSLPEEPRLALWLSSEGQLGSEEIAGILSVSEARLRARVGEGMRELLGALVERGIITDEASVRILLGGMMKQPAPASLIQRIDAIVRLPAERRDDTYKRRGVCRVRRWPESEPCDR